MQSPALLAATESDPLTLEEEFANQRSWAVDPAKYCWIIHSRRPVIRTFADGPGIQTPLGVDYSIASQEEAEVLKKPIDLDAHESEGEPDDTTPPPPAEDNQQATISAGGASSTMAPVSSSSASSAAAVTSSSTAAAASTPAAAASTESASAESSSSSKARSMRGEPYPLTPIGDVNLFLYADFNLGDFGIAGGGCELEVMIAEAQYRRRGLGEEAIRLVMEFSATQLGVERFVVKILQSNTASVELFEKKLGFRLVEYVECFDEVVLFKDTSEAQERNSLWPTEPTPDGQEASTTIEAASADMSRLHTDDTAPPRPETSTTASSSTRTIQDLD